MAIFKSLSVGVVSLISVLSTPIYTNTVLAQLTPQEISAIAKPITVRIDGANEGSRVIIDRSDDTYTVVTNWHVVKVVGEYTVQTSDGQQHPVDYQQTQQFSESADLAIIKFTSNQDYDVASLGESIDLGEGETIHLAGYPGSDQIIGQSDRFFHFYNLSLVSILPIERDGGYTLSYAGENFSGMSGSPILDSDGNIIGINGTSYLDIDGKARSNYAIPIDTYKELAANVASESETTNSSFQDYLATSGNSSSIDSLVKNKLNPVPVFTIADNNGAPLVASTDEGDKIAGVFISQQDADRFVIKLKAENPELASQVEIIPVSLAEVYNLQKSNQDEGKNLDFVYVPEETSVDEATTILNERGKEYEGGVPLFIVRTEDGSYLTIEMDGKNAIPLFFKLSQLEELIQKFKKDKPDLAQNIYIDSISLEDLIEILESENDETLNKIVLIPTEESIEFLQK